MNSTGLIGCKRSRLLAERAKRFIYLTNLPISRLARDVDDIARFEAPGPLTPHMRLIVADAPLTPASADILDAMARVWGDRLFAEPNQLLLESMALLGPIAAAEAFLVLSGELTLEADLRATEEAFASVFVRHPDVFLADTRKLLMTYSSETWTRANR
jgi:hypothetical protein